MTKALWSGLVRGAPLWQLPAVVIATGPSLDDDQLERVRVAQNHGKVWSVTANNAFERAPTSTLAYFGDYLFGKVHITRMLASHKNRIATGAAAAAERWKLHHVPATSRPGLGMGPAIHLNGNSGMQAVNLAAWLGARRILMIGFDMRVVDGKAHYFGQHPAPLTQTQLFGEWQHKAIHIAADARVHGIDILNCTPDSALDAFPHARLDWELNR